MVETSLPYSRRVIAFESRLKACSNVITLGVRPNFSDYPVAEAEMIRSAKKIYYPTSFYADLFDVMGKETFPSYHSYKFTQDKIKQTALFDLMNIPQPRTRVFYGKRQKASIGSYFSFPFIAKTARGSALGRGVFLIQTPEDLQQYLDLGGPAYIQQYLPVSRDMRVVVIGKRVVHAYWRIAPPGEFRSNVAVGGRVSLDAIDAEAVRLALYTATVCRWDDVGIDICCHDGQYYVLEGNMKYGKEGFRQAGIDYIKLMETLIDNGDI